MAQPGRPAAIASDGVDRGRQCCNRVGIKARAIEPRTAAPSGLARRRQREQGGVAPDLADDLMAEAQGGADQRAAHVPGVEQQARPGADRAQQSLGDGELAGVAGTAAQAGDQRHRARPIPARHHGGQRDEALAQQERRPVDLGRVVEADRNTGRLGRAPGRQRVVDHDEAPPLPDLPSDDPAQCRDQAEQPEPAAFEHPVVGLPAQPRRQRQDRLRDMPARRQQGADDQLHKRQPRGLRAGLHDLPDPSAKGRREAGLVMRFHGVCGRLVAHPLHENQLPGDTLFKNPHRPSKAAGLETPDDISQVRLSQQKLQSAHQSRLTDLFSHVS